MKKITLAPFGESATIATGASLLSVLRARQLRVLASCGGKGICSTCHIRVERGSQHLSPIGDQERRTLSLVADTCANSRLACQTQVFGDGVEILIPEAMYLERTEDLHDLLGTIAAVNILHPISGVVLIPKGKLITRSMLNQSRRVESDIQQMQALIRRESPINARFTASCVTAPQSTRATLRTSPNPKVVPSLSANRSLDENSADERGPVTIPPAVVVRVKPEKITGTTEPARKETANTPIEPPFSMHSIREPGAGDQIDHYLLLDCVGKGGGGVVFRSMSLRLHSLVAVKFLRTENRSAQAMARLGEEARLLAQLSHANIVRVMDYNDNALRPYIVMELIDGVNIAELIRQSGRLAVSNALEVTLSIVAGLEAALRKGVVHRDVKPENILVQRFGEAKLMDFGLAIIRGDRSEGSNLCEGTISYMSPEQARATAMVDHRSDIYSLGVTLFQMLTGRLPFLGANAFEVLAMHAEAPVPNVHIIVEDIPPKISSLIRKMMAKDPASRFQNYEHLRMAIQSSIELVQSRGTSPMTASLSTPSLSAF